MIGLRGSRGTPVRELVARVEGEGEASPRKGPPALACIDPTTVRASLRYRCSPTSTPLPVTLKKTTALSFFFFSSLDETPRDSYNRWKIENGWMDFPSFLFFPFKVLERGRILERVQRSVLCQSRQRNTWRKKGLEILTNCRSSIKSIDREKFEIGIGRRETGSILTHPRSPLPPANFSKRRNYKCIINFDCVNGEKNAEAEG